MQPGYTALDPAPGRPPWGDEWGPTPFLFPDSDEPVADEHALTKAEATRARESRDVARVVATAVEHRWCKEVRDGVGYRHVPLQWKDICILIPSRTVLPFLEKSLDAGGIEFRSEASSLVYSMQEVHDLLLTCRALANTADEAALVAALRTPLFGCGDDDLLRWKAAGGVWSIHLEAPEPLADSPVAAAFAYLRELSREFGHMNPAALLSRLATDRRVFEVSMDSPRHRDVWRRLRFVIDQARAWYAEDRGSLRDYLDWAATQADENARVAETVLPEIGVNAVRIMTIHAAKGLQFPMVVVAGMSGGFRTIPESLLWNDDGMQAYISAGVKSLGYEDARAAERDHDEAEKIRLLYVVCTRAESHLAVSGYVGDRKSWGSTLQRGIEGLPTVVPALVDPVRHDDDAVPQAVRQSWEEWSRETAAVEVISAQRASYSATRIVHGESAEGAALLGRYRPGGLLTSAATPEVVAPGRASADSGTVLGTALHAVLESVPLGVAADAAFEVTARNAASVAGITDVDHFVALARSALESVPVRRAATREHWREMQLAGLGPDGVTVVEGVADLVYREDDGSLVVLDYKTDVGVSAETLEAYWAQLAIYAELLRAVGERVGRVELVFCRGGEAAVRTRKLVL